MAKVGGRVEVAKLASLCFETALNDALEGARTLAELERSRLGAASMFSGVYWARILSIQIDAVERALLSALNELTDLSGKLPDADYEAFWSEAKGALQNSISQAVRVAFASVVQQMQSMGSHSTGMDLALSESAGQRTANLLADLGKHIEKRRLTRQLGKTNPFDTVEKGKAQVSKDDSDSKMRIGLFISYSHDSHEHKSQVLDLAQRLRVDGIDANLDQFHSAPPEGWPIWMQHSIEDAQFVLVICTANYKRHFEGREEGRGLGATWEGFLTISYLHSHSARNQKFIPILFPGSSPSDIPSILLSTTRYQLPRDYEKLYRRLTNQPEVVAEPLGEFRQLDPLPPKEPISAGAMQPSESPAAVPLSALPDQVANKKTETLIALAEEAEPFMRRVFNTPARDWARTELLNKLADKLNAASIYLHPETVQRVWKYITEVMMAKAELEAPPFQIATLAPRRPGPR